MKNEADDAFHGGGKARADRHAGFSHSLILDKIVFKEVRVQGVLSQNRQSVLAAPALAESRKYPIEKMVTHRLPLAEAERALRMVAGEFEEEGAIKVVLVP